MNRLMGSESTPIFRICWATIRPQVRMSGRARAVSDRKQAKAAESRHSPDSLATDKRQHGAKIRPVLWLVKFVI